jgi:ribonucleoside-diphosphate reductase subunit M1
VSGTSQNATNGISREADISGEVDTSDEEKKEGEPSEADIYSQKVLQCSIENKEACIMCQG